MAYQAIFQRNEIKYILTLEQKARILQAMEEHMALDRYGRTTIRNLYFDTDNYRLIRHSIEHPVYKEKLRLRSYAQLQGDDAVFVELKKKYHSTVYKRRVSMPYCQALAWLCSRTVPAPPTQIGAEIDYFLDYYRSLQPVVFLSYEREAYYCKDGGPLRITFDDHILCRQEALSLEVPVYGVPLLESSKVLMEIKTSEAIPLWLTRVLTKEGLHKASFSKYGTAYQTMIFPKPEQHKGVYIYV